MKLVIATKNKGKIREIRKKLSDLDNIEVIPLTEIPNAPEVIEDGETFVANALKKAREISVFTKLTVLADDSGLVIDALRGRPGVYSARYGGETSDYITKNKLILKEMKNINDSDRTAKFVCVMALKFPEGKEEIVRGECWGEITSSLKGTKGFGYDPIFFLPKHQKTMAEISLEEKNRISHRAQALEKIKNFLTTLPR